jgi:outer membrane protein OmpA-like peptidoglycan-associated protein
MMTNRSNAQDIGATMSVVKRLPLALVVALAVSMTACETTNPYTGETEVSKATKGAGIGAAAGAIAGAIFGGGRKSVLISAGVGALAGGLVGNYMDQQDAKLRARLQGTGVSVTRVGDQIILNMPGNVTFASNSSDISAGFYPVLDSVAVVLNEYNQTYVDVVGHTDSTGSDELNQRLSEQRALSVARYLEGQQVLSERIMTRGLGPKSPVASNATPEGRALNRRVEIVLTPIT